MKKVFDFVGYLIVRLTGSILNILPFSFALYLSQPIGFLMYTFSKRPRKMAFENLHLAFQNEKSEREIQKITKGTFVYLAEFGIEWLMMPQMIKRPERYLIEVSEKEKIPNELKKKNGAIVLVTHAGNWEVMALVMGGLLTAKSVGASVYAIGRPLKNTYLYQYAVKLRAGGGLKTIDKSGGVQETFDRLKKENAVVCMLIDQRVSEGSIETDFFGRPALTTSLPIVAALRLGTPIFFSFLYRTRDLRYEMKIEGPILLQRTGDFRKDIEMNTQHFVNRVEEEIRKNPSHWLWMHNRWRVQHGQKD